MAFVEMSVENVYKPRKYSGLKKKKAAFCCVFN